MLKIRPIKTEADYDAALARAEALMDAEEGTPEADELDVLATLIEAYEDEHVPMPDVSEIDVLRELMRSNGLSQTELAKAVGITQSTISSVLTGARALTKAQILKLASFFSIAPAAFLPGKPRPGSKAVASRG